MTTSAFSTGILRIYPTRENAFVVGFVFRVLEDTPLHPECPFAIASSAILAFGRFEIAQVLKHQDASLILFGKLHNASAHEMRDIFIDLVDLVPEIYIVLFTFREKASLASVASNPP